MILYYDYIIIKIENGIKMYIRRLTFMFKLVTGY